MPGHPSIVLAPSRSSAVAQTLASIDEANYQGAKWCEIRAVRAPEFDRLAEVEERRRCLSVEYAQRRVTELEATYASGTTDGNGDAGV